MKIPLSVVVIAKNEAHNIERCLRSVAWADECLVVVDNLAADTTVAPAQACGAKVLQESWRGFGPQKAFAARSARNDWILSLDADEEVSPQLAQEIAQKFRELDPACGYEMPRQSFYLGRWIRHGGWYPDPQLRLFNRQHSMWNQALIHERVECPRKERLHSRLLHYVFRDLAHQIDTNNRYSTLQADAWIAKGGRFSWWKVFVKPPGKFFECYVWKRGFLDGMAGYVIAVGAAYSVFLRWVKIWEKQKGLR